MRTLFNFILVAFVAIVSTSCSKFYMHIERQYIGSGFYASSGVGTPNPKPNPHGERLVISWKIPTYILKKKPKLILQVIYGNFTEETITFPIEELSDYVIYTLVNSEYDEKKGLITYKASIVTDDGQVFKTWTQQLWVNLITPEED